MYERVKFSYYRYFKKHFLKVEVYPRGSKKKQKKKNQLLTESGATGGSPFGTGAINPL